MYNGVTSGIDTAGTIDTLRKSLMAGSGTDALTYVNGRAMQPEDCEMVLMSLMPQIQVDCKLFYTMKKVTAKEGAATPDSNLPIERGAINLKYLQTRRSVTKQMEIVETFFEKAYALEKIAGVEMITMAVEHLCFHGDSSVVPTEFDGFLAKLNRSSGATIVDYRGKRLSDATTGEAALNEIAYKVWQKNGDLCKVMYPGVLANEFRELFSERMRFFVTDANASFLRLPDFPTAVGSTIQLSGEGAGADKFFCPKGVVSADGNKDRPNKPAKVKIAKVAKGSNDAANSKLTAGTYYYTVHAINENGISAEKKAKTTDATPADSLTIVDGDAISITITPPSDGVAPTGYIICRNNGKTEAGADTRVMEMVRIPAKLDAEGKPTTTTYTDKNEDLPGTASMVFLPTLRSAMPAYGLAELCPISTFPLQPYNSAETPFLVLYYATLAVRAPEHCALAKNIAYKGGLYYK